MENIPFQKMLLISEDETLKDSLSSVLPENISMEMISYNPAPFFQKIEKNLYGVIIDAREDQGINYYLKIRQEKNFAEFPVLCITEKTLKKEMAVQLTVSTMDLSISFPFEEPRIKTAIDKLLERTKDWYRIRTMKKGTRFEDVEASYIISEAQRLKVTGILMFEGKEGKGLVYLQNGRLDKIKLNNLEGTQALDKISHWRSGFFKLLPYAEETPKKEVSVKEMVEKIQTEKGVKGVAVFSLEGKEIYVTPENYTLPSKIKKIIPLIDMFIKKMSDGLNFSGFEGASFIMEKSQFMIFRFENEFLVVETSLDEPLSYYIKQLKEKA